MKVKVATTEKGSPDVQSNISAPLPPSGNHDASHQLHLLRQAIQSDKARIGFFLGAGCPLGIYDESDSQSIRHIPDVAGLTSSIRSKLEESALAKDYCATWDTISSDCLSDGIVTPNVEHILTELRGIYNRKGNNNTGTLNKHQLRTLDADICDIITKEINKPLPKHHCSYNRFATWVGGLHRSYPIEIFTPNYDLLLEQAFEQRKIPHFDGFVGSREPFFDLSSIEQDAIPARWTRLWKLHGSVNWECNDDGRVTRVAGQAQQGKAMIYPSHLKYDQSRRMPYLAMIDRIKAFFKASGSSQYISPPVLIICGYSFADDHLNEILLDGLNGNRTAQCFALAFGSLAEISTMITHAKGQRNLSILAYDGAVIGGVKSNYRSSTGHSPAQAPWLHRVPVKEKEIETEESEYRTCNRIGDFHYFCLFLEQMCGGGEK